MRKAGPDLALLDGGRALSEDWSHAQRATPGHQFARRVSSGRGDEEHTQMIRATFWILVYAGLVLAPVLLLLVGPFRAGRDFGRISRWPWVTRP
ncbi:MAG: hypothetical protein AMXMBFR4_09370 [Candidatus Hydrogenedentota bacterium]